MKIFFGTDHAGFEFKNELLRHVRDDLGYEVEDCGAFELDPEDDYPKFIGKVAEAVSEDPVNRKGIILGGSGQGEAISANRFRGVRAVVYYGGPHEIITLSRQHNDANVLSIGARFGTLEEIKEMVSLWLDTDFSGDERHKRRIEMLG